MNELAGDLESLLYFMFTQVDEKLKNNNNIYIFDVEQIIRLYADELNTILLENIHDFYLQCSNLSEARINNIYRQNELVKKYIQPSLKETYQTQLDKWLSAPMRKAKNIQESISNLKERIPLHIRNITTSEDLLKFEVDEAVVNYMSKEVFVASEHTLNRVTQKVYDIIKEKYAYQGEGVESTTTAIQEEFTELARHEAERIARTETLKAQGDANYRRLQNNTMVEYKQWLATEDEATRETHDMINEQITTVDGIFENGLEYPGDTNGDPSEWENCRCDLVAYFPEIGYEAPDEPYWFESDMIYVGDSLLEDLEVEVFFE